AVQRHELLEYPPLFAMALVDVTHIRCRSGTYRHLHQFEIAPRAQQSLRRREGRRVQKSVVPTRLRPMFAPECQLERDQVRTALHEELAQLPADQQVVRPELSLTAVEVVATPVKQVRQQSLGGPGASDGIDDDLDLHVSF